MDGAFPVIRRLQRELKVLYPFQKAMMIGIDPLSAGFKTNAVVPNCVAAAADAVPGFKNDRVVASRAQLTSGFQTREPGPNNSYPHHVSMGD
jgi:hypothetical protein